MYEESKKYGRCTLNTAFMGNYSRKVNNYGKNMHVQKYVLQQYLLNKNSETT